MELKLFGTAKQMQFIYFLHRASLAPRSSHSKASTLTAYSKIEIRHSLNEWLIDSVNYAF
jgi:hypothetical protein